MSSCDSGSDLDDENYGFLTLDHTSLTLDRTRLAWLNEHFDELQELYKCFQDSGRKVFGNAYFQRGGFHTFIEFVHTNTY